MKKLYLLPLLALLLAIAPSCNRGPNEKTVSLLVHQDRWGEIAPCG